MPGLLRLLTAAALLAASAARAEDAAPLRLRVNPAAVPRPARESLEEKVARRQRESDFQFRWICRGCLPGSQEPGTRAAPPLAADAGAAPGR